MNGLPVRIGKGLIVHIVFAALSVGLIWMLLNSFDDASQSLRDQFADAADNGESVLAYLADARGRLIEWAVSVLAVGWILSALFVSVACRFAPSGYEQSTAKASLWWGLGIAMVIAGSTMFWFMIVNAQVLLNVDAGNIWLIVATVALLALIGFFLATAIGVKLAMKRSVPLSGIIPDSWN